MTKSKSALEPAPAKVLVLRTCNANLLSRGGKFQWSPVGETTTAPDWRANAECGNGLHGWLWGSGDWDLKEKGKDITWLVVEVDAEKVVNLGGKVKFPSGKTLAVEKSWAAAMAFIRGYASYPAAESNATGDSGHASATGDSGHASATGNYGHASATGYSGHASATGYSGHASATGNYGHASATGDYGWAITGYDGRAKAGKDGCITMAYHDGKRMRIAVGYVGEGLKEGITYTVNSKGDFVEVAA